MGPVQALDVADELGMGTVVIPPLPGLFSSLGLLFAEVEHHLVRTHYASAVEPDFERLNAVIERVLDEAKGTLEREGYDRSHREVALSADTRYEGQDYALPVPFTGSELNASGLARLVEDFHREHEKTYGYRSDEENVQITGVRVLARGLSDTPQVPDRLEITTVEGWKPSGARECFFGPEHGWIRTDVMDRGDLTARKVPGAGDHRGGQFADRGAARVDRAARRLVQHRAREGVTRRDRACSHSRVQRRSVSPR